MNKKLATLYSTVFATAYCALSVSAFAQQTAAPEAIDRRAAAKPLPPGGGPNGEEIFNKHCAECHESPQPGDRAPPKAQLRQRWADEVVTALTTGVMKVNGVDKGMTEEEIDAVATYLTGNRPPRKLPVQYDPPSCASTPTRFPMKEAAWNGWSPDATNVRYQAKPGLKAKDISRLQVKWSFAFNGSRYGQLSSAGGYLFATSSAGNVYALDAKSGCKHWRYSAGSGVRTTVLVGANKEAPSGYAAYFGTYDRAYVAVDAASGKKLWETTVDDFRRQTLTGSPVLHKDKLIVPVSAWEESGTAVGSYECCRARGSVLALNAMTGKILWKTYMLPEAQPWKKNSAGTQMWAPAGASIWSTPTIDAKRNLVYITTGDTFVEVKEDASDSVMALDLDTGAIRWKRQLFEGDWYLAGCPKKRNAKSPANCPEANGPDFDFGASAFLVKGVKGKDMLVAGQKSSAVHALNPDTGELLWTTMLGKGSALGGVQWGMASDGKVIYAPNADIAGGKPGVHAVDPKDGKVLWYTAAPKVKCSWQSDNATAGTVCVNGNSQAGSLIPGAFFAGTLDGHLRAYDPKTGSIMWDVDTAAETYQTINGPKLNGGSLDAGGPIIVNGMVYVLSGYAGMLGGNFENVVVAYSVDGK